MPSSLVITMPVTPTISRKISACACAFWPVVASSTSSTECGACGSTFLRTRTIFCNSDIRLALLCSRPAVSISRMSVPSARACSKASKASPAASDPAGRVMTRQPVRSPQICSCSTPAARNVSPAASSTWCPASRYCFASLAIVVVFPLPLTPTTRMTNGLQPRSSRSGFITGSTSRITSSASALRTSSGETSWLKRLRRSSSVTSAAIPIPISLAINNSSSSSSAASSSRRRLKIVLMPAFSRSELRAMPALRRANQPRRSSASALAGGICACAVSTVTGSKGSEDSACSG